MRSRYLWRSRTVEEEQFYFGNKNDIVGYTAREHFFFDLLCLHKWRDVRKRPRRAHGSSRHGSLARFTQSQSTSTYVIVSSYGITLSHHVRGSVAVRYNKRVPFSIF